MVPRLGVVLGSGFGGIADAMETEVTVPFTKVAGLAGATVPGHAGKILLGTIQGVPACVFCGRLHYYEGHSMEAVTFPVRIMAALGVRHLLLTNAAGGIHPRLRPGDFMVLRDHINFMGVNPLRGWSDASGQRFVDLSQTYDPALRRLLQRAARSGGLPLRQGIYLAVSGPSYETPAEIRAFARLGADAVGMSTVPEAIVARQCGLAVAGLSCITNRAAGLAKAPLSHDEVLAVAECVRTRAVRLINEFVKLYAQTYPKEE